MQILISEIKIKEPVLSQALAMEEFQKWLNHRKSGVELILTDDAIDVDNKDEMGIIEALMTGNLILNEDMSFTYKLIFPLTDDDGNDAIKELKLKSRLSASQFSACVSPDVKKEPMKMFINMISVLSGELKGVIGKLESCDYSILQKICNYFL